MESSSSGQSRTAKSSLTVIALDVSPRCLPLLPAVKDALAARLTHEMLANAKTAEVALMAFGTKGKKKKKKKRKERTTKTTQMCERGERIRIITTRLREHRRGDSRCRTATGRHQ